MSDPSSKSFMTAYLLELKERSRIEKGVQKWGLDWVIYNLGQSMFGKVVRLPFLREPGSDFPKSKTETEYGIDVAFLSDDSKKLFLFVLKSEKLTNRTWIKKNFEEDLRKSISPDLSSHVLSKVECVKVILAYNRDDDFAGVRLYENFANSCPTKLGDSVTLELDRWNLSDIVQLSLENLLSPSLLPHEFFGKLSFICSQFSDFKHGSDEWEQQLIPAWRRFMDDLFRDDIQVSGARIIPIALLIIREQGRENPTFQTGWIDLVEWTTICLWDQYLKNKTRTFWQAAHNFWTDFYIVELFSFYSDHNEDLSVESSIDNIAYGAPNYLGTTMAAMVAYWHLARLGILWYSIFSTKIKPDKSNEETKVNFLNEISSWFFRILNANESIYRPILDIHHIQIYLVFLFLINEVSSPDSVRFFQKFVNYLYVRRNKTSVLPFIEGQNSLENIFEYLISSNKSKAVLSNSSLFVMMLLELSCAFEKNDRNNLLRKIFNNLVMFRDNSSSQSDVKPLELISWTPPEDWEQKVFNGPVTDGICTSMGTLVDPENCEQEVIFNEIKKVVSEIRNTDPSPKILFVPIEATILASLKFGSPLPPELWRRTIFENS